MNGNARQPERIEAELARTRDRLDGTLSELQQRLSPGQLLEQTLGAMQNGRDGASDMAGNLAESVRNNPLPVALIGIGLGWLMMSGNGGGGNGRRSAYSRQDWDGSTRLNTDGFGRDDGGSEGASSLREKAQEATDRARQGVADAASGVARKSSEMMDRAGEQWQRQSRRVQNGFAELLQDQPLVLIGAGLAVGALLGAGLPTTRRENELLGETRDRVVDKAAEVGRQQAEKARDVANAAAEAAADAAREQGLTQDKVKAGAENAEQAVKKVAEAAKEGAKKEASKQS